MMLFSLLTIAVFIRASSAIQAQPAPSFNGTFVGSCITSPLDSKTTNCLGAASWPVTVSFDSGVAQLVTPFHKPWNQAIEGSFQLIPVQHLIFFVGAASNPVVSSAVWILEGFEDITSIGPNFTGRFKYIVGESEGDACYCTLALHQA
jgi:hypothetical protein